ncbi:M12 family metallo-peptidase [Spirosoma montaniterrae]|uniref:Fibronectin type-III domain-containing protein n=1 Tax=Spirosoma montaniterrae TaxID=1178516 RepID=A0A1P9X0L1_9BACT|nr:M12 family metallo-peptidase [Spirosoma montaniterrae]AQG81123.1 hypothetical protein AWR27_18420 [Spirosoma montaniterrae]
MYKFYISTIVFLFCAIPVLAQNTTGNRLRQQLDAARSANSPQTIDLFSVSNAVNYSAAQFKAGQPPVSLRIDSRALSQIVSERPALLALSIPAINGPIDLELVPVNLFAPDFALLIGTDAGTQQAPMNRGVFYQGFIKNKANSLASVSIVDGVLSGFVADETGNRVLSQLPKSPDNYLFFYDNTLASQRPFICQTEDSKTPVELQNSVAPQAIDCKVVAIYLEADYQMYIANGSSVVATTNYITSLFNQVATIYNRENIAISLAGIKVWTTTDPYASRINTNDLLITFTNYQNTNPPPGISSQLSQLLSTRQLDGGRAYIDVLCVPSLKYGVNANMQVQYVDLVNYSWEVNVLAHELGHNFGSPHTHSCLWPGGPIDNCAQPEGNCQPGPSPTNGGTMMSYCHTTFVGINFANAFGPLPGNLLRNRVSASTCVSTATGLPTNLAFRNVQPTTAKVYWQSNAGSTTFTLQYRPVATATWTTVGPVVGQEYSFTGLQPSTAYAWRVTGECSSGYSAEATFTTGQPVYCTPTYSNNGCSFGIGINRVVLSGTALSNNTGCSPIYFTYFSSPVGSVSRTSSNTLAIDFLGYFNGQQVSVWIDLNQDYIFDLSERVYATTQQFTTPIVATFSLPAGAPAGVTRRMRIRNQFWLPVTDPCGTLDYGETEDYQVFIDGGCPPTPTIIASSTAISCQQSTSLTVTNCPGTVAWSSGSSGSSIVVAPTQTTTYTATCTQNGCSSSQTSVIVVSPNTVSRQSGSWTNPAIWSCNRVPDVLSPVTIQAGHIVTIPANITAEAQSLRLLGSVNYLFNARLRFGSTVGSLLIPPR